MISHVIELKVYNQIIEEDNWIYLAPFYKAEQNIAERILILQTSNNVKKIDNIQKELKKIEKHSDIELSDTTKDFFRLKFGHLTDGDPSNLDKTFNAILDTFPSSEIKLFIEDSAEEKERTKE